MIAATISQAPPGSGSRAFAADDANPMRSIATRTSSQLPDLLRDVASEGWNGPAGAAAVAVLQQACRREAPRWRSSAGSLTDEGLGDVWEQIDRLVRSSRFDDAPGLLVRVVRRAYACEAAAAQTGMGSAATRGLIAATDSVHTRSLEDLAGAVTPTAREDGEVEVPRWMRVLGAVLAAEGWHWPMPALNAVEAAAACVALSGRKRRSPMAGQSTGVPDATWSALIYWSSGPVRVAIRQPERRGRPSRSTWSAPLDSGKTGRSCGSSGPPSRAGPFVRAARTGWHRDAHHDRRRGPAPRRRCAGRSRS